MRRAALAFWACLPALAWAQEGTYVGHGVGWLELSQDGGVWVGRAAGKGACAFEPQATILEGRFEDGVLTGAVRLCQVGDACPEKRYPFLAFYSPRDGALWADIRLDRGCASPGLEGSRLLLLSRQRAAALGHEALLSAEEQVSQGAFDAAARLFEQSLRYAPGSLEAQLGWSRAERKRGNAKAAVARLEAARAGAGELGGKERGLLELQLACAHVALGDRRAAAAALRTARRFDPSPSGVDTECAKLLGSAPPARQKNKRTRRTR